MDAVFLTSCISSDINTIFRPYGPYQLAWYLRKFNYQVQVADFLYFQPEEQIYKIIGNLITPNTRIVGLGMMVDFFNPSTKVYIKKFENVIRYIRKNYKDVTIIAGSPLAYYLCRFYKNKELFDYFFFGHAEDGVLALANHLYRGGPAPQFEIVDGNRVIRESFSNYESKFQIEDCVHRWDDSDYIQPGETLPLELSRGCMFKCKFCQYPHIGKNKKDFNRRLECVKEEIIDNYNRWGVTNYYMLDDTFNADQTRIKEFSEMVSKLPFKINYVTYLRIDLLYSFPESQDILYESGLRGAFLGIETLNPQAGKLIDKPWGSKYAKEKLPELYHDKWKKEVSIRSGWIAGLPPQTLDELLETNKWLIETETPAWSWFSLFLNKDSFSEYRSDFDRNAEEYGFKWKVFDGRTYWKTDYCDALKARDWQIQLNNESKEHQKIACWQLFEFANYGIDINEAKHTKVSDFDWPRVKQGRDMFLRNYFKHFFKQI